MDGLKLREKERVKGREERLLFGGELEMEGGESKFNLRLKGKIFLI